MASFGKKLQECREDKGLPKQELAKILKTSHSVIGRYERDEMSPSIEAVKKFAQVLDTTVGYLLGEAKEQKILKDTAMLKLSMISTPFAIKTKNTSFTPLTD